MNDARRWLVPLGGLTVAAVVVVEATGEVGFGGSGNGLLVLVGSALFAAGGMTFLLWRSMGPTVAIAMLGSTALGGVLMHHGDPGGPVVSLFLVMALAPFRLGSRQALLLAIAVVTAYNVDQALTLEESTTYIVVTDLGAAFFFLLGSLVRIESSQRHRAEQLVLELDRSRRVEREAAVLSERARIARDMHDILAHTMSGLVLQLEGARLMARQREVDDELRSVIDRAIALAKDGSVEARRAVATLRGEELPGPEQIPHLLEEHRQMGGGDARLTVEGRPRPMGANVRLAAYRAVQESLSNVRKHAPRAGVEVALVWNASALDLTVQDDGGAGSSTPGPTGGHGLAGMAERVAALGGSLSAARNDIGFVVKVSLPLADRR